MKYKFLHSIALFAVIAMLFASCIKDDLRYTKNEGKTLIKLLDVVDQSKFFFTPFTNVDSLDLFSARKDANSNADLNIATVVTLTSMPEVIDSLNNENGTSFETLPDSLFTLTNTSFVKTATGYTLNFAPGDFAKAFSVALDGAKWDLAHTYALAFGISASGDNVAVTQEKNTIVVYLSVKNKYQGTYAAEGWLYHPASPRAIAQDKEVVTAGPSSVTVDLGDLGGSGYKALITVDEATNKLTIVAAPGAAGGPYTMFSDGLPTTDPGYSAAWSGSASCNNTYDPATQTFYVRYGYHGGTGFRVAEEAIRKK